MKKKDKNDENEMMEIPLERYYELSSAERKYNRLIYIITDKLQCCRQLKEIDQKHNASEKQIATWVARCAIYAELLELAEKS